MANVACKHESVTETGTYGFTGSVSRDENRAAHGNVCLHEECALCGARRRRNVNQHHQEIGPWGPSARERKARVEAIRQRIPAPPAAITMARGDREIGVSVDHAGMIVVYPALSAQDEAALMRSLPPAFVAAAQATRRGVLALRNAEAEAES